MPELNRIYRQYRDRAAFYVVYISEAHPVDRWQLNSNVKDDVLVRNTTSDAERMDVAGVCVRKLGIEIPAVVDDLDNQVEQAYTGWPDRMYVIDKDGRVALKSAAGPFGFKPEDVEATLKQLLP